MWGNKRRELEARIASLEARSNIKGNEVICCVCGCLVNEHYAIRGEGEIRLNERWSRMFMCTVGEEYIYHPYYCKIHAPHAPIYRNEKEEKKDESTV